MSFISYAQTFEDVMLWRALGHVSNGFYIDIGAWSPNIDSVTRAFYERGWSGINAEPNPEMFRQLETFRKRDINICAAISNSSGISTMHFTDNSGLSTLSSSAASNYKSQGMNVRDGLVQTMTLADLWRYYVSSDQEVHFLKIDVEGFEKAVLQGGDWQRNRPWIVVVEATEPMSQVANSAQWEPLLTQAHYSRVYADGLNLFFVASERRELSRHFELPPNLHFDAIELSSTAEARKQLQSASDLNIQLSDELRGVHMSKSWRWTQPLRKAAMINAKLCALGRKIVKALNSKTRPRPRELLGRIKSAFASWTADKPKLSRITKLAYHQLSKFKRRGDLQDYPTATVRPYLLSEDPERVSKIAVIKIDHLGDVLLSTPVFSALRRCFPKAEIHAIVQNGSACILQSNADVDVVHCYAPAWLERGALSDDERAANATTNNHTLEKLRSESFDLVINLRDDDYSLRLATLLPARRIYTYSSSGLKPTPNCCIVPKPHECHVTEQHRMLLLLGLGIDSWSTPCIKRCTNWINRERKLDSYLSSKCIAICPGAGVALKKWPASKFADAAAELVDEGYKIIIIGSKDDSIDGDVIKANNDNILNLCGKLSLRESADVVARCNAVLCNDSVMSHIGAAVHTPTITIIRPHVLTEFRPTGTAVRAVMSKSHCMTPCAGFVPENPRATPTRCKCIEDVSVRKVIGELRSLLEAKSKESFDQNSRACGESYKKSHRPHSQLIVCGDLNSNTGYAIATQLYINQLRDKYERVIGMDLHAHRKDNIKRWIHPTINRQELSKTISEFSGATDLLSICLPPEFVYNEAARNIGLFFWENTKPLASWAPHMSRMDELWLPSQFMLETLPAAHRIPLVRIVDVPVDRIAIPNSNNDPEPIHIRFYSGSDDGFMSETMSISDFKARYTYVLFSVASNVGRKGLPVLISEWYSASKKMENAALILKISSIDINQSKENLVRQIVSLSGNLRKLTGAPADNVFIICDSLSDAALQDIQSKCDGYISCSFGEGFGLNAFQALACNRLPIIPRHTAWQSSFPKDYPLFIDCEKANFSLTDPARVYSVSSEWAVPKPGYTQSKIFAHRKLWESGEAGELAERTWTKVKERWQNSLQTLG